MLPPKPFYLIRHGQSEANIAHITAGGQLDSPLTDKGRAQGQTLSPYLSQLTLPPTLLYHSDMQRARDTANYLNVTLQLKTDERHDLREHDLGIWDGQPWVDILPQLSAGIHPPGGESKEQFAQRIQNILTDILTAESDGLPMIVAHGGLFHAIGFIYEYAMSEVQNCHLHYFEPNTELGIFPWRVWKFDIEGEKLVKSRAPF